MSPADPTHPGVEDGYPMQMRRLILAIMVKGPKWTPNASPDDERDQAEHLDLLKRLRSSGDLLLSGPIPGGDPERGFLVFDHDSEDQVRDLLADDAHMRTGQLAIHLFPWLVPADILERPLRSADRDG